MPESKTTDLSRRNFIKGAALTAAAMGGLSFWGCSSANAVDGPGDVEWAKEADVVVVGFGYAGVSAAIEAARNGASVLVLEKAPEEYAGGNSAACVGHWVWADESKKDNAIKFIKQQVPNTVADEEIEGFVDELITVTEWAEGCGIKPKDGVKVAGISYSKVPGADGIPGTKTCEGPGNTLWNHFKDYALSLGGISVAYETAGYRLIFNQKTREVYGVVAIDSKGNKINIKAKKAVIMGIGGYENNKEILWQYQAINMDIFPWGTPYNTGDGLPMVMEVGARVRHFGSVEWGSYACMAASKKAGAAVAQNTALGGEKFDHAIIVNGDAQRFDDENLRVGVGLAPVHAKVQLKVMDITFAGDRLGYKNQPFYMLMDKTRIDQAPLFDYAIENSGMTWVGVHQDLFSWSKDNQKEVEAGYILKADTIAELAQKAGLDPAALQATVDKWNAACDAGVDVEHGRTKQLTKIETAPFYITELAMTFINTQGGPDRNANHQVLDWEGKPIPRLYAGGEFGSIYGWFYQGAGNVPEGLGTRVAGKHAAALESWDA